jgi:hypothetical protein
VTQDATDAGLRKNNFERTGKTNIQLGALNAEFYNPRYVPSVCGRDVVAKYARTGKL